MNQAPLCQLLNPFTSKAVNVQGVTAGPVAERTAEDCWTTTIDATGGGLQSFRFL